MNKVLIIGCGHMGSALLNSWIGLKSYTFSVVDPYNFIKLSKKYNKKNVTFFEQTPTQSQINKFDVIIFAVKPQVAEKVINQYQDLVLKKTL